MAAHGIALPEFVLVPNYDAAVKAGKEFGYPFMLKNRRLAYDGRGNAVVKSENDILDALLKLGAPTETKQGTGNGTGTGTTVQNNFDIYAEKWVEFTKELAVMIGFILNFFIFCYLLLIIYEPITS